MATTCLCRGSLNNLRFLRRRFFSQTRQKNMHPKPPPIDKVMAKVPITTEITLIDIGHEEYLATLKKEIDHSQTNEINVILLLGDRDTEKQHCSVQLACVCLSLSHPMAIFERELCSKVLKEAFFCCCCCS